MIGKDEIISFKKMWTWLSGYPAHDREYYMKNVARLDEMWTNSCPLATSEDENCDGCRLLWYSKKGTLCTDKDSPLYKWKSTSRERSDDRSFYASHIAVLAMNAIRTIENESTHGATLKPDHLESRLHS